MVKQILFFVFFILNTYSLNAQGYFNFKMADAYNHKEIHFTQLDIHYKNFNPNLPTILITWSDERANSTNYDLINRYNLVALNKVNLITLNIDKHTNESSKKTKEELIERIQHVTKTWKNAFHFYADITNKEQFGNLFSTSKSPLILVFHSDKSLRIAYDNEYFFPYQFGLPDVKSIINIPDFFTNSPEDLVDYAISVGENKYATPQEISIAQNYIAKAELLTSSSNGNISNQYYKRPVVDLQIEKIIKFKKFYANALLLYNSNQKIGALKNIRQASLMLDHLNSDKTRFYNFQKNKFKKKVQDIQNKLLDEL